MLHFVAVAFCLLHFVVMHSVVLYFVALPILTVQLRIYQCFPNWGSRIPGGSLNNFEGVEISWDEISVYHIFGLNVRINHILLF